MPSFGSVLLPLYEEDGLQIGELGRRSGLSKQTMTALIRRVERVGLIERRGDPDDGRATLIFLTGSGSRVRTGRHERCCATSTRSCERS